MSDAAGATSLRRRRARAATWRASGWSSWLPAGVLVFVLACLVVPPIVVLVQTSFRGQSDSAVEGAFTFENYVRLLADPKLYRSAANSLIFAVCASVLSLSIGGILAWIVERTDAPLKRLAYMTGIVSLGTPYILYVSAWLFLLGRAGPFNDLYRNVTHTDDLLINVYSLWGMSLVEGFLWSPLVFLLLSSIFRRANAEMEEAARIAGASIVSTIWNVSVRLAWPAILGLGIFVFIRNIESFDVPVLIGTSSHIDVLTTDIYLSLTEVPPQVGHASSFSVILILLVSLLLSLYGRVSRNADRYASMTGKGFRPRPFALGRSRWVGGAIILLYFIFVLVLPLMAILWNSLTPFTRSFSLAGAASLTLEHYEAVLEEGSYIELGWNTIIAAATAASAAVFLTLIAAWLCVRRWPGHRLLDQMASVPLVFPGIVLGVAMIQIALRMPFPLYGSIWLIAIAFLIRYLPYGMRYAYAGVLQIHRELEEAAGVAGATQVGLFRRIVAPMLAPSIIAAWLFIFLLGSKELSLAVLLSGPDSQTMAVAMFDQWSNGQSGEASALGVAWTAVMTAFAFLFYFMTERGNAKGIQG